jgi:hypothetical protein
LASQFRGRRRDPDDDEIQVAESGKKKPDYPGFVHTPFGVGDMYTRKGSGRMTDDLPSDLGSAKPGRFGAHAKGGAVKKNPFAKGGSPDFGNDYRKK